MNTNKTTQLTFGKGNPFGTQTKLLTHKDRLGEYLYLGDTKVPIMMEVGLTNKCNMNCKWCITENGRDNTNGAEIDFNILTQFIKDFSLMGGKSLTFCGQGEPTLYKHFISISEITADRGLQLGLMSNGVFPTSLISTIGQLYQWVRFSIDTVDEEAYYRWKGIRGVKIIQRNIELLQNHKVKVGINCNVGNEMTIKQTNDLISYALNEPQISYLQFRPILPRYYKKENAQLNTEVWNFLDTCRTEEKIILSDDKREDILKGYDLFNFTSCEGHFFEPILDAEGNVKVCTYHPDNNNLTFGNIYNSSFQTIWSSEQRKKAIKYARELNYRKDCQACCKLAEPNKLLDFINNPKDIKDINFL